MNPTPTTPLGRACALALLAATLSCFRVGRGGGGGGCDLAPDGSTRTVTGTYTGRYTTDLSGSAPVNGSVSLRVESLGSGSRVSVSLGTLFGPACSVTAVADACDAEIESALNCDYSDGPLTGSLRFTSGTLTFGADSLRASVRWEFTPSDGSPRTTLAWDYSGTRPSTLTSASCSEVCDHGRRLGCPRCLADTCVSYCEAQIPASVRALMLNTNACRVSGGSDSFDQCDRP